MSPFSSKRPSHPNTSTLIPYRECNNKDVRYVPSNPSVLNASSSQDLNNGFDSDAEPLITSISEVSKDALEHFTATGRPIPILKPGMGHIYTPPHLLPLRYTDDSIIPAIVVGVLPSPSLSFCPRLQPREAKRKSHLKRVMRERNEKDKKEDGTITKVVYMPRREYLKYFARGKNAEYVGTEPWRQWSEEELEREFGKYRPPGREKKNQKGR